MKKLFLLTIFILSYLVSYGEDIHSHTGIEVKSIVLQSDGSYAVELCNTNTRYSKYYGQLTVRPYYIFDWYLSYKGERVSDYFNAKVRVEESVTKTVFAWPDEVPKGHERYVTVQFGREPARVNIPRDRRDDW